MHYHNEFFAGFPKTIEGVDHMKEEPQSPSFDDRFPELQQFICELVDLYEGERINSWDDLEALVNAFFTPERMQQMESQIPHWTKMTSYREGVTLTHVLCVFMGLYMLPEYQALTKPQQNLMKWVILLHDVEKEVEKGKRDPLHAFRSAAAAAKNLPKLGFTARQGFQSSIEPWSELVFTAVIQPEDAPEPVQDNQKYPEILEGIDRLYGRNSAGALIVKTILFHISINVVRDWPQAAPLTTEEIKKYVDADLLPLLKVMMLADNEGWVMFYPEDRSKQRSETLQTYELLEKWIL
jgi:hypothetical protein